MSVGLEALLEAPRLPSIVASPDEPNRPNRPAVELASGTRSFASRRTLLGHILHAVPMDSTGSGERMTMDGRDRWGKALGSLPGRSPRSVGVGGGGRRAPRFRCGG